ncbi:hypothetical protein DEU56DRAFT_902693 [Suillus clintonianus]|uniref:uncharacterized protein n=1 Tax=Suillus clintonianus TaxID=1904413 RepID=UPI001B885FA6|nr:uncharacterized protein DEU56DRAFT_902693 [Suillus clintonianus]KAG2130358.1 hypothetical protein DEU56DRAFT_902693 [Suillus clintonianus]
MCLQGEETCEGGDKDGKHCIWRGYERDGWATPPFDMKGGWERRFDKDLSLSVRGAFIPNIEGALGLAITSEFGDTYGRRIDACYLTHDYQMAAITNLLEPEQVTNCTKAWTKTLRRDPAMLVGMCRSVEANENSRGDRFQPVNERLVGILQPMRYDTCLLLIGIYENLQALKYRLGHEDIENAVGRTFVAWSWRNEARVWKTRTGKGMEA